MALQLLQLEATTTTNEKAGNSRKQSANATEVH